MQNIHTSTPSQTDHTHLIQALSAMMAHLKALQSLVREDAAEGTASAITAADVATIRNELTTLEQLTREMLYDVRSASDELALEPLPGVPLAESLTRAVDETAETMQLSSRVVFSGEERPVSNEIERLLYRIARDTLSQVQQHTGVRKLRFVLHYRADDIQMSIEDDGVPSEQPAWDIFASDAQTVPAPPFTPMQSGAEFSPADDPFAALRHYAEHLGGSLEVITSIEQGTQVRVSIPYVHHTHDVGARFIAPTSTPASSTSELVTTNKIRILIVDNHAVTRAGLRRILESQPDLFVVGEAIDGVQAVSETAELGPQVVIMDAQLPNGQSLEALRQIKLLNPETHVLLLSTLDREEYLYETLRAGAGGYILKDIAPDELTQAVRTVARGEVLVQPQIAGRLISRFGKQGRAGSMLESLTARELEVLRLLARGLRNKEIAARLFVSERTVNFHLANIYQKLNVSGRTEALSKAHEQGLLTV
jgi:DNA-binding NarL/FixJ family response regulator